MSNTGQALANVQLLLKDGDNRGAQFWASKATRYIHDDLTLPLHIEAEADDGGFYLRCTRCGVLTSPATMANAARFRDWHFYCGMDRTAVTPCTACGRLGFYWENDCRACEVPLGSRRKRELVNVAPRTVLMEKTEYIAVQHGDWEVFTISCNTIRQARSAAERIMPFGGVTVRAKPD